MDMAILHHFIYLFFHICEGWYMPYLIYLMCTKDANTSWLLSCCNHESSNWFITNMVMPWFHAPPPYVFSSFYGHVIVDSWRIEVVFLVQFISFDVLECYAATKNGWFKLMSKEMYACAYIYCSMSWVYKKQAITVHF